MIGKGKKQKLLKKRVEETDFCPLRECAGFVSSTALECLNERRSWGGAMLAGALEGAIRRKDENVILKLSEAIDHEFSEEEKGGIIIFSTDTNAIQLHPANWINKIKQFFLTWKQGYQEINKIVQNDKLPAWTVGKFFSGKYTDKKGNLYSENSFSVEIIGVTFDELIQIADDLCADFVQQSVLVRSYTQNSIFCMTHVEKRQTNSTKHLVVLTGAGVSAESGISTFRGRDGVWEKYDVDKVSSIEAWHRDKAFVLDFFNQRKKEMLQAQPNVAHRLLAELEKHFQVSIITQNIDNLHERAGSTKVLHLHGEITKACNEDKTQVVETGDQEIHLGDTAPDGSQLRPFVVWFGEQVPLLDEAIETVYSADILLIVGTSLNVQPAASLLNVNAFDIPVFLIDPDPKTTYRKVTVIPTKASEGMKMFRDFVLDGKPLPAYEYKQAKETDEILLACNKAIEIEPDNPDNWIQKSQRLGELQLYDEAMICQDEAMKLLVNNEKKHE